MRRHQIFGHDLAEHLLAAIAEEPLRRRVELEDARGLIERDDAVESGNENGPLTPLALAQRRAHPPPLRHVEAEAENLLDAPLRIAHRAEKPHEVAKLAVFLDERLLETNLPLLPHRFHQLRMPAPGHLRVEPPMGKVCHIRFSDHPAAALRIGHGARIDIAEAPLGIENGHLCGHSLERLFVEVLLSKDCLLIPPFFTVLVEELLVLPASFERDGEPRHERLETHRLGRGERLVPAASKLKEGVLAQRKESPNAHRVRCLPGTALSLGKPPDERVRDGQPRFRSLRLRLCPDPPIPSRLRPLVPHPHGGIVANRMLDQCAEKGGTVSLEIKGNTHRERQVVQHGCIRKFVGPERRLGLRGHGVRRVHHTSRGEKRMGRLPLK